VAVVSGAGNGMGREIALLLRRQFNCHLALCDVNAERLRETMAELDFLSSAVDHNNNNSHGVESMSSPSPSGSPVKTTTSSSPTKQKAAGVRHTTMHVVDVSNREQVFAFAEEVRQTYGRCELVVAAAGVAATHPFHEVDLAEIDFWRLILAES